MKRLLLIIFLIFCQIAVWGQINTNRVLNNGRNALYFEDYVLSIQYFNQVISLKPYLAEPYHYRAIAKIQLEDFVGAEIDCSLAIERNPFLHAAYYARGYARKRLNKHLEATADFTKALEFSPENPNYIINRIEAYEQTEQFAEALADIDFLLTKKTKYSNPLWIEKTQINLLQGDTNEASKTIENAIQKDSSFADFFSMRAFLHLQQDNKESALEDYNKAIELKSENITNFINRGILNYRIKNYRAALTDYDKAIELDNTNIQALFNRALLRTEVGDLNNAMSDLDKILDENNQHDEARYQRALVATSLHNYQQAIADFKQIIEKYPHFVPAYFARADANQALGNKRQAAADRYHAQKLMDDHNNGLLPKTKDPIANEQLASNHSLFKDEVKNFDSSAGRFDSKNRYADKVRGQVQNTHADVHIQKNFIISYYSPNDNLRNANHYNTLLESYKQKHQSKALLTNNEIALTQTLVDLHFDAINQLTTQIEENPTNYNLFFERALHHSLVVNQEHAIADMTKAINANPNFMLAYFCRANILAKMLDYEINNDEFQQADEKLREISIANKTKQILADYDKAIQLAPHFPYLWFNRGNLHFMQKNHTQAIQDYTQAIQANPNLGQSYFNRALSHLHTNQIQKAIQDFSKAGELGIYQSYNLIKRFGRY